MKISSTTLLLALALAAPALTVGAQDEDRPRGERPPPAQRRRDLAPLDDERPPGARPERRGREDQRPMGPGGPGQRPPLIAALDRNHDGEIDAREIENASTALRELDKNQDGRLTIEELRPARPAGGPQGGPRGGEFERGGPRHPRGPGLGRGGEPRGPGGPPPREGEEDRARGPLPPPAE